MELNWLNMTHSIVWYIVSYTCPIKTKRVKTVICSKHTAGPSCTMSCSDDTFFPLWLRCLKCSWRSFCLCLQHHATVVTSNGVTICGSKFPPTVSNHCKHQHSAIPKTIKAMWHSKKPSWCDIQGAASSVKHHGCLCTQSQQILLWCISRPANRQQS
jgi:hypothetical protein